MSRVYRFKPAHQEKLRAKKLPRDSSRIVFVVLSINLKCEGEDGMLGKYYARLIERHSEELAEGLVRRLQTSDRTEAYRSIPTQELKHALEDIYSHLGDWLDSKTELDVQDRYAELGRRRAEQGIPLPQVIWALIISKEHLWTFLEREALADTAVQLLTEVSFILSLEQFFDRAIYYTVAGYTASFKRQAA